MKLNTYVIITLSALMTTSGHTLANQNVRSHTPEELWSSAQTYLEKGDLIKGSYYLYQSIQQNENERIKTEAQFSAGMLSIGFRQHATALEYLKPLAEQKNIDSNIRFTVLHLLGQIYLQEGATQDKKKAKQCLQAVANQNDYPDLKAEAQEILKKYF